MPYKTLFLRFLAPVILIAACSAEESNDINRALDESAIISEEDTRTDTEENTGLTGVNLETAMAFCEKEGVISVNNPQKETQIRPAMCLPGTTPGALYLTISVEENLHPKLGAYRTLAATPMTLHLDKISQRGFDEEGVESYKRCRWYNYEGYGIFPFASVSFSYFDAVTLKRLEGVSVTTLVKTDADTSIEFRDEFARRDKPIPMDCSVPFSLKAVVTPNWGDGLDENNLPTMISVSVSSTH